MSAHGKEAVPTDVTDDDWAFVAPYLTLMRGDAPQRARELREVFNALRWLVRAGAPWRMMPSDFPPWEAVISRPSAGSRRASSRRWSTTCVNC